MGLRNRSLFQDKVCFFVTTSCYQHLPLLTTESQKIIIAESLNFISKKYQISILGYVIMPNHLHLILYFRSENKLPEAMRDFKKFTATQIRKELEATGNLTLLDKIRIETKKQVFKIWQDRFDDSWIGSKSLLETKLEYIHQNPLQAHWNLAKRPEDYPFSSAGFYNLQKPGLIDITDYREFF